MPEIGYWKYVRFNDDEPQYWGTDDDIVQIFDSADDRLEYRMKKDIRFEDDAGNEILTLDKVNRHVKIPVQLNVAALEEYAPGAGITVKGSLTFSGADLDLAGNLLKNPKLGTDLKTSGYKIYDGVSGDTGRLMIGGGSTGTWDKGGFISVEGINHPTTPGRVAICASLASGAFVQMSTANAALTALKERIIIGTGDVPDIDIKDAILDFATQTPVADKVALNEYIEIKVGGVTKFLRLHS